MAIGTISSPSSWALGTVITPAFLQNVTDNINSWIAGTGSTFKSLQVDGTGGSASTQTAGTIGVSATIAGSIPTTSFAQGTIYKDLIPFAYGSYSFTSGTSPVFSAQQGVNFSSIARSSAGQHKISLVTNAVNGSKLVVVANGTFLGGLVPAGFTFDNTSFLIHLNNSSGVNTDLASGTGTVTFVVFGS